MNNAWLKLEDWLCTTTGQEFLDELVWGTVGIHTLNGVLSTSGLAQTQENRDKLVKVADKLLAMGN